MPVQLRSPRPGTIATLYPRFLVYSGRTKSIDCKAVCNKPILQHHPLSLAHRVALTIGLRGSLVSRAAVLVSMNHRLASPPATSSAAFQRNPDRPDKAWPPAVVAGAYQT